MLYQVVRLITFTKHRYFKKCLQALLCLLLSFNAFPSDKIETGFFESLDLAPEVFVDSHSKRSKTTILKKTKVERGKTLKSEHRLTVPRLTESHQNTNLELPEMWHYVLLTLIALVFIVILLVLLKIHRNTKEVESTDNIVLQMKNLSNSIEEQSKSVKDVKLRIQKTENSFLKVLAHHIDDKNEQLLKDVDMQLNDFAALHRSSNQQYTSISTKINDIESLLGTLKEFVAEQKQEIRRMQDGYDWSVVNALCLGIIEVIDKVDEELRTTTKKKEITRLNEVRGLLVIMLETHQVKELHVDQEKNYSESESDKDCEIIFCDSEKDDMHGKIANVIHSSFIYEGAKGDNRIVRRAKIEVYR